MDSRFVWEPSHFEIYENELRGFGRAVPKVLEFGSAAPKEPRV